MIRKINNLDRVVRNTVIGVVILGLMFLIGILANWTTNPKALDIRWASYSTPLVGQLNEDGTVTRHVDAMSGLPIANRDGTVTFVTQRCGPVEDVPFTSSRSWLVEQPTNVFLRVQGDTISITVPATPDCVTLSRDYQLPEQVEDLVRTVPESRVTLSFLFQPLSADLGAILLETEPFHRWQPDRTVKSETLRPGQQNTNGESNE